MQINIFKVFINIISKNKKNMVSVTIIKSQKDKSTFLLKKEYICNGLIEF